MQLVQYTVVETNRRVQSASLGSAESSVWMLTPAEVLRRASVGRDRMDEADVAVVVVGANERIVDRPAVVSDCTVSGTARISDAPRQ